jgi:hypothetical protein
MMTLRFQLEGFSLKDYTTANVVNVEELVMPRLFTGLQSKEHDHGR